MIAFFSTAFGQKTYIWKGGKPGRANDWNCPANWSTYRVPDEFADVIIPLTASGTQVYPVIKTPGCEVNSLTIKCGARVTIEEKGSLTILNPDYCDDVSRIVAIGKLYFPGRSSEDQETSLASRLQY